MKTAVEQFWQDVQEILPSSVDTETGIKLVRAKEQAKEMENEKIKEMEFLKFQRDVYIKDIEILKARLREAEQNNK